MEKKDRDFRGGKLDSPKLGRSPARGRARGRRMSDEEEVMKPGILRSSSQERSISPLEKLRVMQITKCSDETGKTLPLDAEDGKPEAIGRRASSRGVSRYVLPPDRDMKPVAMASKQGTTGTLVPLLSNYFVLRKHPNWCLFEHRIDFDPPEDNERRRKGLLRSRSDVLGAYIFDGTLLYSQKNLEEHSGLEATRTTDNEKIGIKIVMTLKLEPEDNMYLKFFNLVMRKCLYGMDLELMGRNFFDRNASIKIPSQRLELWPGFVTSIRRHENEFLLCTEITHKVLRLDNVNSMIQGLKNSRDFRKAVQEELCGFIVMTHYNRKTYSVTDIAWDKTPRSTFDRKGSPETYAQYYETRYEIRITDMDQPLLLAKPKEKDFHRGKQAGEPPDVYLVPETCQMTGLSDSMRSNFSLMKDLSKHLHMPPAERVNTLSSFINRLTRQAQNVEELDKWGMAFDTQMTKCVGRLFPREGIVFAGPKPPEMANDKADWTMAFRSRQMLTTVNLERWAIVVPQRDAINIDNLIKTMTNVAKPLNMNVRPPLEVVKLADIKPISFTQACEKLVKQNAGNIQLIFIVLPNNKADLYASIKKRMSIDYGVPSQCFLAKNLTSKGLMSIATKVVIQINAKLGGQPWSIQLPLKKSMFVGFDVYHGAKGAVKGSSIGALVSTTSQNFASYFSTISYHKDQEELSKNLTVDLGKAIYAYEKSNGEYPERIFFFRDGVSDGQLHVVVSQEVSQINTSLSTMYGSKGLPIPKLSFIVVTKKINTRVFTATGRPDNPLPGTVVDNVITLPDRYDFYLISAAARQGTVSPCSYVVLHDTQGLEADKIQRMTYKMCHMYFNWSGTVAVPAPCQYAHKLAYLSGLALGAPPSNRLQHLLHFL